jgi:hypothetical protein
MPPAYGRPQAGKWYVLAITAGIRVWRERPAVYPPQAQTGGRPRRQVRLAAGAPRAETVAEGGASLPRRQWQRRSVGAGAKGPRLYDGVRVRVIERREDLPAAEVWLLARRSTRQPEELA